MGERGQRPLVFWTPLSKEHLEDLVLVIPGTGWRPGAVTAAWDIAWKVGEVLGIQVPPAPTTGPIPLPGLPRYYAHGFREVARLYQKEAAMFLARRAWGFCCLPCRTGKCLVALMSDVLVDSRRTLICAPSLVKWVWAEEIAKWTGESAIILEGRGGREAKRYCVPCDGTGRLDGDWCPHCRQYNGQSYGYNIIEVRTVSRPVRAPKVEVPKPRRPRKRKKPHGIRVNLLPKPRIYGPRYPTAGECERIKEATQAFYARFDEGTYCCTRHEDVRSHDPKALCMKCRQELIAALRSARYIISNYDILVAQEYHSEAGELLGARIDLPGWTPVLTHVDIDVAILDEAHILRGRPDKTRRGKARNSRLVQLLRGVPRVWCLTGTPIYGYTRDLYSPADIASNGLFNRGFYCFDERYCEGHIGQYGWENNGRSMLAETELKQRMEYFMYQRHRKDILSELPDKQRQVVRIDPKSKLERPTRRGNRIQAISRALGLTLEHKLDEIVENVVQEMAEGNRVLVFTFLRASAERVYEALDKAIRSPQVAPRMRKKLVRLWLGHGEVSDKGRFDLAREYRAHNGGGAFVTTVDAMQVGISLKGAASVHFAELHYSPAALLQAEDRPYEVGITGLTIVYYIVKGSIDEHVEKTVLPKFETQVKLTDEEGAKEVKTALCGKQTEQTVEEIWARLTAHLDSEDGS
jgi:hypothetical protein